MRRESRELRLTSGADPQFRALVRQLDQEYIDRFGPVAQNYQPYHTLENIQVACLLFLEGQAVACGALQPLEGDTAELKRVYVRPEYRRRSCGRQVVEQLELQALFLGYRVLALETGRAMPEAIGLYTKLGYRETSPWGLFVGDSLCLCMKKELV